MGYDIPENHHQSLPRHQRIVNVGDDTLEERVRKLDERVRKLEKRVEKLEGDIQKRIRNILEGR